MRSLRYFGVVATIFLLLTCPSWAGRLSPELANRISGVDSPDSLIDVIIQVNDSRNSLEIRKQLLTEFRTNAERHRNGISQFKSRSAKAQNSLLNKLNEMESAGLAKNFKSHWLMDAITARVSASELKSLADRSDIVEIQMAPKVELIKPEKSNSNLTLTVTAGVQPNLERIGADQAWAQELTGKGRVVCSFDTGIDGMHPALYDNWKGHDGNTSAAWFDPLGKESFPHALDEAGDIYKVHGTHVMGIMVGHDDNTRDTIGVAPDAKWISAAVIDLPYVSLIDAFEWAADPDGDPNTFDDVPDVINHSWGFSNTLLGCDDYFWEVIDNIEALGIVNIFSAGNEGSLLQTITNPANRADDSLDCFAVGAFSQNYNMVWSESSRGPSDCDGESIKPNVVAPGVQIRSSVPGGDYETYIGTSMAAPHVSGAVAILRQYAPNSTPAEIKEALIASCVPFPDAESSPNNSFGWGLINIPAAIEYLTPDFSPNLRIDSYSGSPVNAGETAEGNLAVINLGHLISSVQGHVIGSETGLTTLTPDINFGDIDSGQVASGDILFRVEVDDTVSLGRTLAVDFMLSGDGAYSKTVKIFIRVGQKSGFGKPGFYTHSTGPISFTISNFGQYGFGANSFFPLGYPGFIFNGSPNYLFESAFLIGTDAGHVSDGARNFFGEPDNDFAISFGGELTISNPGPSADQETISIFNDGYAENPLGLEITQKTYSWDASPDNDYVILEYSIKNFSETSINDFYAGLFYDWDLRTPLNLGSYFPDEKLGFMYFLSSGNDSSDFRGLAVLNSEGVASYRLRVIPLINSRVWSESDKYAALSEGLVDVTMTERNDMAQIIATGPYHLAPGQSDTAVFAVIAADNLQQLKAASAQAEYRYHIATDISITDDIKIPDKFLLFQNYPNPFNPSTTIGFALKTRQKVDLSIYNILGEKVANLLDKMLPAGLHYAVWDGTDFGGRPVASGVYFYRLSSGEESLSKKMLLLK